MKSFDEDNPAFRLEESLRGIKELFIEIFFGALKRTVLTRLETCNILYFEDTFGT